MMAVVVKCRTKS